MAIGNMAGGFSSTFFPMLQYKKEREYQEGIDAWKRKLQEDEIQREQERYNSQFVDVTPDVLNNLPGAIQPLYAPTGGAQLGEAPQGMEGLNVTQTPIQNKKIAKDEYIRFLMSQKEGNPLDDELKRSQIFKNYQTGDNDSNINLNRQYSGVMNSYDEYTKNIKARGGTPLKLEGWLRQPGREGSLAIYNQFTGNALNTLPAPYSSGKNPPPQGQTGWYQSHSKPPAGVSEKDWKDADYVMATIPPDKPKSISWVLKNMKGKIPDNVYKALMARSKMGKQQTNDTYLAYK